MFSWLHMHYNPALNNEMKKHIFTNRKKWTIGNYLHMLCLTFPTQMFVWKMSFEKKNIKKGSLLQVNIWTYRNRRAASKRDFKNPIYIRFWFFMPPLDAGSSTYTWSVEVICPTCGLSHHTGSQGPFKCIQPWTPSTTLCFSSTSLKTCQNEHLFFSSGLFHLPPSHQPLLPSDVWFSLCCALAIQTRLNRVQPPAFSSLCFRST